MIKDALICSKTMSGKHIWTELVLYDIGARLQNPDELKRESHKYYKCFACGMIDDRKEI